MPQLARRVKGHLLQTIQPEHSPAAKTPRSSRAPLEDIDSDASPISLSDASDSVGPDDKGERLRKRKGSPSLQHEDIHDDADARSTAKKRSLQGTEKQASLNPESSGKRNRRQKAGEAPTVSKSRDALQTKGVPKFQPPPAALAHTRGDEGNNDDNDLAIFEDIRSSNSNSRNTVYRRKTTNVHARPKSNAKNTSKLNASAQEPERAKFQVPEDLPTFERTGGSRAFSAPLKRLKGDESRVDEKVKFQRPVEFQSSLPSSAVPSNHALSSQDSGSSGPGTPAAISVDADEPQFLSLDSPDGSPVPPHMGAGVARCPMCEVEVDREFLETFSQGKPLRLKAAMDFCVAHRQQNAQVSWTDSKYPEVNWDKFSKRMKKHNPRMRAILEQRKPSFFREELMTKVASGRIRNALHNPEALDELVLRASTGYYGSKGARKMMEHITNKFAKKIRKLAPEDQLFTEVGVGGFIQAVLVPELAVSLVMEDYEGCNEDKARQILAESAEVGSLVHAEEEERVEQRNDEAEAVHEQEEKPIEKPSKSKRSRERG